MCGIAASSDINFIKKVVPELLKRGSLERSTLAALKFKPINYTRKYDNRVGAMSQILIEYQFRNYQDTLDIQEPIASDYFVFHTQAPTGGTCNLHPAKGCRESYLWHNGIIKDFEIERIQNVMGLNQTFWDTQLLADMIDEYGYYSLSEIDGSFACVRGSDVSLHVFRNMIAPMHYRGTDLCSVSFEGSEELSPGSVMQIDIENGCLSDIQCRFMTKRMPYYLI